MAASGDQNAQRLVYDYQHRPAEELYDCKTDPWKSQNLIADERMATLRETCEHNSMAEWRVSVTLGTRPKWRRFSGCPSTVERPVRARKSRLSFRNNPSGLRLQGSKSKPMAWIVWVCVDVKVYGLPILDNADEFNASFMTLLKGEDKPMRENAVNATGTPSLRVGPWKYIASPDNGGDWAQPATDHGEMKKLTAVMPEKVAEMKALLEKLITDGRSTHGTPQKNNVEVKY